MLEKRRPRWRRVLAAVGAAVLLSGCSWPGGGLPDDYGEEGGLVTLRVENLSYSNATLYAVRDLKATRIGIVAGQGGRTFRLPWTGSAVLRIEIDLASGGGHTTAGRLVKPGEDLDLTIHPEVRNSILR